MDNNTQTGLFRKRLMAIVVAAIPLSLLFTAYQLRPSPVGMGTHQQLGLPPCTSRVLFGVRCPSCGMTTSWAYFMHGQWIQSISANTGGFLLAIASCVIVLFALLCLVKPSTRFEDYQKPAAVVAVGIFAVTLLDWTMRLMGG